MKLVTKARSHPPCEHESGMRPGTFVVKHVRCNPDVAPRLTSGGYEDKVNVITPIKILFIGGGEF